MTATMWGADVSALRSCARDFDDGAALIDRSRTTIDAKLDALDWQGRDADEFRSQWTFTAVPRLRTIADVLRVGAEDLRHDADQQERASSDDGSAGTVMAGIGVGVGVALGSAVSEPPFAERIYGREPQEVDLDLAYLTIDTRNETNPDPPDGWERLSVDELSELGLDPDLLDDRSSGFTAHVYVDADGSAVLAFRGSNETVDWINNLQQGAGLDAEQYAQALELAKEAKAVFGDELVFTGTSLGGGLASHAAIGTDTPAVVFNPAGVHDNSVERAGVDPTIGRQMADDGLVRRYVTESDAVTFYQEDNWLTRDLAPDGVGHRIELADPEPLPGWFQGRTEHRVDMHMMEAVLEAMHNDRPWE